MKKNLKSLFAGKNVVFEGKNIGIRFSEPTSLLIKGIEYTVINLHFEREIRILENETTFDIIENYGLFGGYLLFKIEKSTNCRISQLL